MPRPVVRTVRRERRSNTLRPRTVSRNATRLRRLAATSTGPRAISTPLRRLFEPRRTAILARGQPAAPLQPTVSRNEPPATVPRSAATSRPPTTALASLTGATTAAPPSCPTPGAAAG